MADSNNGIYRSEVMNDMHSKKQQITSVLEYAAQRGDVEAVEIVRDALDGLLQKSEEAKRAAQANRESVD